LWNFAARRSRIDDPRTPSARCWLRHEHGCALGSHDGGGRAAGAGLHLANDGFARESFARGLRDLVDDHDARELLDQLGLDDRLLHAGRLALIEQTTLVAVARSRAVLDVLGDRLAVVLLCLLLLTFGVLVLGQKTTPFRVHTLENFSS